MRIVLLANGISAVALPLLVFTAGFGLRGSAIANVVRRQSAALFLRALHRRAAGLRPNAAVMRSRTVVVAT